MVQPGSDRPYNWYNTEVVKATLSAMLSVNDWKRPSIKETRSLNSADLFHKSTRYCNLRARTGKKIVSASRGKQLHFLLQTSSPDNSSSLSYYIASHTLILFPCLVGGRRSRSVGVNIKMKSYITIYIMNHPNNEKWEVNEVKLCADCTVYLRPSRYVVVLPTCSCEIWNGSVNNSSIYM